MWARGRGRGSVSGGDSEFDMSGALVEAGGFVDAAAWSQLSDAQSTEAFAAAWLALVSALLALAPSRGALGARPWPAPVARALLGLSPPALVVELDEGLARRGNAGAPGILGDLDEEIRVVVFMTPGSPMFAQVRELLERNWQAGDERVVAGLSMGSAIAQELEGLPAWTPAHDRLPTETAHRMDHRRLRHRGGCVAAAADVGGHAAPVGEHAQRHQRAVVAWPSFRVLPSLVKNSTCSPSHSSEPRNPKPPYRYSFSTSGASVAHSCTDSKSTRWTVLAE